MLPNRWGRDSRSSFDALRFVYEAEAASTTLTSDDHLHLIYTCGSVDLHLIYTCGSLNLHLIYT
jgi:hypothetical protein